MLISLILIVVIIRKDDLYIYFLHLILIPILYSYKLNIIIYLFDFINRNLI